ncbi:MAG: hypothetical protein CVU11_07180 [Bacteroidetes bacterium HGW-Bacteroidetes-6]|jgi:antitoxin component YwqK of YwqJK toxin-antitoxin module|nr:MAG: hypothetical protein CVU11_07180 [Bacteroidetes bacterium HGW-Bacteroidetes-6]
MKTIFALFLIVAFITSGIAAQNPSDTLNQVDKSGKKHGYWKKYDVDTLKYEGRFDHGVPVGEFIYYYVSKNIKARVTYSENGTVAQNIMYFPTGAKMAEGKYVNQKREGVWLNYDGYDHVIAEVEYKNGLKNGSSKTFYPDGGKLEEGTFMDGERDGLYIQYYPGNIVKIKGMYSKGKRNGPFAFYYPNGIVYTSGKYVNNIRQGDWTIYDEENKPIVKETIKDGDVIAREVYQKDKDPEEIRKKDAEIENKNKGNTSPDNGIKDERFDGY